MKEAKPIFKEIKKLFVRGFGAIWSAIKYILLGPPEDLSKYIGERTFISAITPSKTPDRSSK